MRRLAALALLAVSALPGCGGKSAPPPEKRTVEDRERGYRIVLPPGWISFDNEARSHEGSLFTVQVHSLVDADSNFVSGLPRSVIPELEAWTIYYFTILGEPSTREATLGGESALEVTYRVRIRPQDPPSRVDYWVARHGELLYVLRATYPAARVDADGAAVREALATWSFLQK